MKPVIALIVIACLLTAGNLPAQYYQATQQARRVSARNDAEQQRIANAAGGGAQPAAPDAPPAPAPAPMDPVLQATLKNITGLRTDLAAIAAVDQADPAQKVALLNDLGQAAQAGKASSDTVKKLATDLQTALTGRKKLTAPAQQRLAQQIHALFNSSHLTATQQETLLTGIQNILTGVGVSLDSAMDVVTDLKAVVAETK